MNKIVYSNENHIKKFHDTIPAEYIPNYVTPTLQNDIYSLLSSLQFAKVTYNKFGKLRSTPRSSWCYGQIDDTATYKELTFKTEPIPGWLFHIKSPIEQYLGIDFNAVIINKYENGDDYISWHQDDEKFLDHHVVASISIGMERAFQMRSDEKGIIHEIQLKSGSLLIFNDVRHSLPKRKNVSGVRFNITFRKVKDNTGIGNYYYYNRGK